MLSDLNIAPTVAVKNLEEAKKFYEGTLGLTQSGSDPGGIRYKCGNSTLYVYESPQFAGTNNATYAGWSASNLEEVVSELKSKGVTFEKYDMPDVTLDGDIHILGDQFKAVWFKDPDGNIFAIDEGSNQ